jgi:hypothetical protein
MKCRLCDLEKPLIEAHIIAKCLLKPMMVITQPHFEGAGFGG